MAVMAAGVYLAFDGGPDASGPDEQGIGPYDEIVLRGARAVGERDGLGKIIALRSAAGSWRDAETASAESDHAEIGRGDLRVTAGADNVVVRFSDDEVAGHASVPDLGPFAVVVIGAHDVRGDEETLAVRVSRISPWQLTDRAGASFQGTMKDALIFAAAGHSAASQARPISAADRRAQPMTTPAANGAGPSHDAAEEDAPSVWVDRVKVAPNIYISRPDRKR
jgi:hypothetical protein